MHLIQTNFKLKKLFMYKKTTSSAAIQRDISFKTRLWSFVSWTNWQKSNYTTQQQQQQQD